MGMSDRIEAFILELMKQEEDDWTKIQRNELAQIFGCVPSQINYVISTRFNPERGYLVESRRGGGGCVKIRRAPQGITIYIADRVSEADAVAVIAKLYSANRIDKTVSQVMAAAVSDTSLESVIEKDRARADILKNMLNSL